MRTQEPSAARELAAAPALTSAAALLAKAAALLADAASRLAASPPIIVAAPPPEQSDRIVGVAEAAEIAQRSVSWLRKHGRELPGYRQPTGRGGRVGWSRKAVEAWASRPAAANRVRQ